MTSRYNQILQPQNYVDQYIPLPLDVINQAGAAKQKAHDKTLGDLDAAKELLTVKADPNRYGDRDELLKSYTGAIDQLADEYIKSDNSAEVANKLYKLKRSWSNDPIRMGLESSAANYDAYLKDFRENQSKGLVDPNIRGGYDTYAEDQTRDEQGNFKPFVHKGLFTAEDLDAKAKAMMGTIASDGSDFQGAQKNKDGSLALNPNGSYWSVRSGGKGVKRSKAENIAITKSEAFISDPKEGRYFIDKLLGQHVPYSQLDAKTKDYVQQEAAKYLYQSAANQIGWETKSGSDLEWLPVDVRKPEEETPRDPWTTFTPQIPGKDGGSKDERLTNGMPANMQKHMMYKDGKIVSKKDNEPGFWDGIWKNVTDGALLMVDPNRWMNQNIKKVYTEINHKVEASKEMKDLLTNYSIATGKISNVSELNDPKTLNRIKDEYSTHLADAITANREVLFDETTSKYMTDAILPTLTAKGEIFNPNLMGSTTVYDLNGKIVDDALVLGGGKILGADSKHPGRLLISSRNGNQYSIDPNVPDFKLVTKNISDFDAQVIDRIATGSLANDNNSLYNYYSAIEGEIDKYQTDANTKNAIKSIYKNNIDYLVESGYKMSTANYGGKEVPIAIKYNDDGTVDKKVIAEVPGTGATIMDIGEYKNMKTQESFVNSGVLPSLGSKSDKQYQANTIR